MGRRERGILMHARSVRGILADRKGQTRRIVKPQPVDGLHPQAVGRPVEYFGYAGTDARGRMQFTAFGEDCCNVACFPESVAPDLSTIACPYGAPGDLLYVRETWAASSLWDDRPPREIVPEGACTWYGVDGASRGPAGGLHPKNRGRWRPSIHMPKWASRIWLELTDVRVERVQDISQGDVLAEGVEIPPDGLNTRFDPVQPVTAHPELLREWRRLWDDTNGHRDGCSFEDNPWVWPLTFRHVEGPDV